MTHSSQCIPSDWDRSLSQLLKTDWQIALAICGGGTSAIQRCFARSGASNHFVQAVVPYSRAAMAEYLRSKPPQQAVSQATALVLAKTAFSNAVRLSDRQSRLHAGISLTAALPTVPPRDQHHQVHVALVMTDQGSDGESPSTLCHSWFRDINDPSTDRVDSEAIAESMVLGALETIIGASHSTRSTGAN